MVVLYAMMACQLIAWGWFSAKGGKVSDRGFLRFTVGMLLGQLGAGVETFQLHAWGAFVIQAYFFIFTAYGGYKRWHQMKAGQ